MNERSKMQCSVTYTPAERRFLRRALADDGRKHLPAKHSVGAVVLPQQYGMVNRLLDHGLLTATTAGGTYFAQLTERGSTVARSLEQSPKVEGA